MKENTEIVEETGILLAKQTLDCVLESVAAAYSLKPAIIFEELSVSYYELYNRSKSLALGFRDAGIRKGDKVAILLPNCIEYMYVYFALFLLGAWAVPLSTRYEPDELRNVIRDSDAKCIVFRDRISTFDYNCILASVSTECQELETFICLGKPEIPGTLMLTDLLTEYYGKSLAVEENGLGSVDPDDVALLAYTSGTTGAPRGVMITHGSLVLTSYHTARLWDVKDEVAFSVAPLYAAQGFLAVLIDLVAGVTMKWISNFNPNDILAHLVRQGVTAFHTQPTMWSILLSLPAFRHLNFSHLKKVVVSGSLCSYGLAKRIRKSIGCVLLNAYGLVEATGIVTVTRPDDPEHVLLGSVGSPIPGVRIKIVDEARKEVAAGVIGELAVRGYLMKGYYKNEEKTREVIDSEGWLYTGDQACYCEDGKNIRIVGRCKDMIIRGGFNVYPIDIEECLLYMDSVLDVSVVGKEDDILGQSIAAFVIPKPDAVLTEGDVKRYLRGKIANYKLPDEVFFVSEFPILLSGKVCKNILAEWAVTGVPEEHRLLFNGIAMGKNR